MLMKIKKDKYRCRQRSDRSVQLKAIDGSVYGQQ